MASCRPEDHLTLDERKEIARQVWRSKCESVLEKEVRDLKYDVIDYHRELIEASLKRAIGDMAPKEVMDYFRGLI